MDSSGQYSQMFKVDHSEEMPVMEKREENFFHKDKVIIEPGEKRKVIYGAMDEQQRSIYEILQPYLWKMAESTGGIAQKVGQGVYNAICTGAGWAYEKLINSVIPYTAQQIPKLLFVVTKKNNAQNYQSDSFQVIEVDDPSYDEIKKREQKKNKTRVIVPFDKNQDPTFVKFLEKEEYVPNYSFPIDIESKQSESFLVPSASFICLHDEVTKNLKAQEKELSEINQKPEQRQEEQEGQKESEKKIEEQKKEKKVEYSYKMAENRNKTVYKLKDCYIFEYEGQNSIEYELLDGIEKNDKAQPGYLLCPQNVIKSNISSDSNESHPGETPLLVAKQENVEKLQGKKVKVEIPKNIKYVDKEEEKQKQLEYA